MPGAKVGRRQALNVIPGVVPDLIDRPSGCSFRERCPRALETCAKVDPDLELLRNEVSVACHNPMPREEGQA
jgi:oligopeptide/dipeptide ABC transporter ATP-binding protein